VALLQTMARFDIHRNPGRLRDTVPFVVIVQSAMFNRYNRRLVVPVVKASNLSASLKDALDAVVSRSWG
jgi:toxin CcdB